MRWLVRGALIALLAAVPVGAQTVNEINYDDDGTDFEEFIEVFAAGGGDYSAYDLVLYNGNGGAEYLRVSLGTIPADGYKVFGSAVVPNVDVTPASWSVQNGAPDGIAIVVRGGACVEFLSYEGTFTATTGECNGILSTDIGVADFDPAGTNPAADVVLQRIPNITGNFIQTSDGTATGVIADGTPGLPNEAGATVVGKLTALAKNSGAVNVDLCIDGGQPPYTTTIRSLPANGTLSDAGGAIAAVPHNVNGQLRYTPAAGFAGLNTFNFDVTDSQAITSPTVTQELAVQENLVLISEIMHTPSGDQRIYEFVEIYNYSASPVTLTRLDTRRETTVNTVGNLNNAVIPANSMKILAIDSTTNGPGFELSQFRCEWRLAESDIIRVDISQWEFLFSPNSSANCVSASGPRLLLYGMVGMNEVVLDAVDMGAVSFPIPCTAQSYALNPDLLFDPPTTIDNDVALLWTCAGSLAAGQRRTGDTSGDISNIAIVPLHKPNHTYELPCFGACCLDSGACSEGVSAEQCLELRCGLPGGFTLGAMCIDVTCPADPDHTCCLPTGTCVLAAECECISMNGSWDGATRCDDVVPPECPNVATLVINELDYDTPSVDDREFIEIYNSGNQPVSLAGWSLEFFNGADLVGDNIYRTVDLSTFAGGALAAGDYLVVGSSLVPNVDILWASATNQIQNGTPPGDGVVLLIGGVVIEALSYDTGTTGFTAIGGNANGTFLPDIGVVDTATTTLQKLPDNGAWTSTFNNTPGAMNFDAGLFGACCDGLTCLFTTEADCTSGGFVYLGDGTNCNNDPCVPRGGCCLPDGSCSANRTENQCNLLGGTWLGAGTICPNDLITTFVNCVSGPSGGLTTNGCATLDCDADMDIDLYDYWCFQQQFPICIPDPVGACCPPDGVCVEISQFECAGLGGDYRGNGVLCAGLNPPCEQPVPGAVLINELWADDPAADDVEFFELKDNGRGNLVGLSFIIVDGDTSGDPLNANYRLVNFRIDFTTESLAGGYFTAGTGAALAGMVDADLDLTYGNANTLADEIQNGSQTYALVLTSDIAYCTSNGVPDASCHGASLAQLTQASYDAITAGAIDTVATKDSDFDHAYFFAPLVRRGAAAIDYAQRIPDGTDTNSAADWETGSGFEFGDPADPSTPDAPNTPASQIAGACCIDTTCRSLLEAACITSNGIFNGPGTGCTPNPCICTTIAEAELSANGTQVCVTGAIITRDWDNISSTTSANFYIQDAVGTNGIVVFGAEADIIALLNNSGASMGDAVEVRGELATFFTDREIVAGAGAITLTVLSSPGVPAPFPRAIASLPQDGTASAADPIMTTLIKLSNVEFAAGVQGTPFAAAVNYTINTVGNPAQTMVLRIGNANNPPPIVGTTIPSGAVDIVGIATAFSGNYQIAVFFPSDITPYVP